MYKINSILCLGTLCTFQTIIQLFHKHSYNIYQHQLRPQLCTDSPVSHTLSAARHCNHVPLMRPHASSIFSFSPALLRSFSAEQHVYPEMSRLYVGLLFTASFVHLFFF